MNYCKLFDGNNGHIAYRKLQGKKASVVFFGGFASNMDGTKATAIYKFCQEVVDWKHDDDKGDSGKREEILEILLFAKNCCSPKDFSSFKDCIVENLKMVGRKGMKEGIDYSELARRLFSQLEEEKMLLSPEVVAYGDHPQSMLGTPGVSGLSGHSK